jgi:hypothetical protein
MAKWGSFNGKSHDTKTMDDQHLSNILWYYHLLIPDCTIKDRVYGIVCQEIIDRFGSLKPLPYRPMIDFKREIDSLKEMGYIKGIGLNEDIIVNGEIVGKVIGGVKTSKFSFV